MKRILLIALLSLSGSFAHAKEPLYFFWDNGSVPDQVDTNDTILNVNESCASDERSVNIPFFKRASVLPSVHIPSEKETQELLTQFQVRVPDPQFFSLVWVLDSFKGKQTPLFILLPEVHKAPLETGQTRHMDLQLVRSYFLGGLIKKTFESTPAAPILNLKEGIEGRTILVNDVALDGIGPKERMDRLAEAGYASPFLLVGNAFRDRSQIKSSYLETSFLISTEILLVFGEYDGRKTFDATVARAEQVYGQSLDKNELRPAFNKLVVMTSTQREAWFQGVCVMRGKQMANRAIQLTEQSGAQVVLLGYGASHHKEIVDVLRANGFSYISLMGRIPQNLAQ